MRVLFLPGASMGNGWVVEAVNSGRFVVYCAKVLRTFPFERRDPLENGRLSWQLLAFAQWQPSTRQQGHYALHDTSASPA